MRGARVVFVSMTIAEETGRMSSTISTSDEGFIIFGACAVP
jgi:hypothetical protein